jgi:hypothetical protein
MADNSFTELRSPRLILRRLRRDDLGALSTYRSMPELARYQDWETFGMEDAAQSGLEPDVPGTWFQLAIVEAATGILALIVAGAGDDGRAVTGSARMGLP